VTTLSNTPHPPQPDGTDPADDATLSPVERALRAARHRAASRRLNRAAVKAGLTPGRPVAPAPAPGRREMLKCRACGRTEPRPADDLGRLARGSWPECCGKVMPPAPTGPDPASVVPAEPIQERRALARRPARRGARAELRRGLMGMGPDLALALMDVSLEGARVKLKVAVCPGEQVEVALWPPGGLRSARGQAVVCWCRPAPDGTAQAGVRFRQRLTANDLSKLVE
jgi:PilZ domain